MDAVAKPVFSRLVDGFTPDYYISFLEGVYLGSFGVYDFI
jgi:hypothetical protein